MKANETHAGGCLCGDVRYEVSGSSLWRSICYCESCTRAAGAPATAWAGFEKSKFRLLKGRIEIYESSPGVHRGFCRRCGTNLFYRLKQAGNYVICAGTFDDSSLFKLVGEIFIDNKPDGYDFAGDHPRLTEAETIAKFSPSGG